MNLSDLSDAELLSKLGVLLGSERELTARLVAHLGEVEERRLHLEAGYSSMFDFCVRRLHLSEGEAYRRIVAARLARRFPVIYSRLASGAVHLSALALLRDRLTEENHVELLDVVSGKSKREVEALLAARYPAPDVPSRIRKLPERRRASEAAPPRCRRRGAARRVAARARAAPPARNPAAHRAALGEPPQGPVHREHGAPRKTRARARPPEPREPEPRSRQRRRARPRPLARRPREEEARQARAPAPRSSDRPTKPGRPAKSGRITNAARRTVFARDGVRCTYVGHDGHRCEARAFLELDHVDPKGLGGADDADEPARAAAAPTTSCLPSSVYGRDAMKRRKARVAPLSPGYARKSDLRGMQTGGGSS